MEFICFWEVLYYQVKEGLTNIRFDITTVIKQLSKSISKRLSDLSSNEEIFEKTKPAYSDALKNKWISGEVELYISTK